MGSRRRQLCVTDATFLRIASARAAALGFLVMRSREIIENPDRINCDPAVFENPREVTSIATGAHLARMEMKISITEFLRRIPNLRVNEGTKIEYRPGGAVGPKALPLSW